MTSPLGFWTSRIGMSRRRISIMCNRFARAPLIFSHSSARAISSYPRNVPACERVTHNGDRRVKTAIVVACSSLTFACSPEPALRFEVSFPTSAHAGPITGRVYVILSRDTRSDALNRRSLGHQPISSTSGVPFFATDVSELAAGEAAVIDAETLGFPQRSLRELPAGDYYVQAVPSIYSSGRPELD